MTNVCGTGEGGGGGQFYEAGDGRRGDALYTMDMTLVELDSSSSWPLKTVVVRLGSVWEYRVMDLNIGVR